MQFPTNPLLKMVAYGYFNTLKSAPWPNKMIQPKPHAPKPSKEVHESPRMILKLLFSQYGRLDHQGSRTYAWFNYHVLKMNIHCTLEWKHALGRLVKVVLPSLVLPHLFSLFT